MRYARPAVLGSISRTHEPTSQRTHMPSTHSIWHDTFTVPERAPLRDHLTTDVCVIGAGIAGLSVAYALARAGKRVVVVEKEQIGSGESGRTTAHLSNALDDRYLYLETVSYTHLRAHETPEHLVCRL